MKKTTLLLMVTHLSLNCVSWPWPSKPAPKTPKVLNIYVCDPIPFEDVAQELFMATKRRDVVGLILIINSNGGPAGEFSVVHDLVKKFSSTRPVVALITSKALSGGYLIASAADSIMAHSASQIGNIGVCAFIDRYKNTRVKGNIEADFSTNAFIAGEFKAIENPYAPPLTESQQAFMQASVVKSYDLFLTLIAHNRNIEKENYKLWAEGKIFLPSEALECGLIDSIGTIFEAQEQIKNLILERNPQANFVDDIEFIA